jgi:chromosome segregation ATPase
VATILRLQDSVRDITRDMQNHQREQMEQRREIQDLNKNVKEIQTDVQKILKLLKTTHISQGVSVVKILYFCYVSMK